MSQSNLIILIQGFLLCYKGPYKTLLCIEWWIHNIVYKIYTEKGTSKSIASFVYNA